MALKYQCYYCKTEFLATAAIDGFNKGYRIGFLCPNCGENIQTALQARPKVSKQQTIWTFIAFILFLPAVFTLESEKAFTLLDITISLNVLCFIAWIAFVVLLLILKPSLFTSTILYTDPVGED